MAKKSGLRAFGEVYNVRERMAEENDIEGEWDDYPDWYEYEMFLMDTDGDIIDSWDSLSETYNGVQKLDEQTANDSVRRIVKDVEAGNAESWFSNVPEQRPEPVTRRRVAKARRSRSRSSSQPTSMRGVRK